MADHDFIRPAGDWSLDPTPTVSEFEQLDFAQKDSVSASGCTVAPATPIIIGGAGLEVPGPCDLDDAAVVISGSKKLEVRSAGLIQMDSGSDMDVKSGADVNVKSGGDVIFEAGSTLTLGTGVDPTFAAPRLYTRRGVRLLGVTYNGSAGTAIVSGPSNDDAWISSYLGVGNIVVARSLTTITSEHFILEVPGAQEMSGATLSLVRLRTFGIGGTPDTYPTYEVFRRSDATTASLSSGGPTTDGHNLPSAWTGALATDIVPDQNAVIDPSLYEYTIKCTPASKSSGGTQLVVQTVLAVYSVTKRGNG